jgi:DNA-binding transcriptional LysR family regulator
MISLESIRSLDSLRDFEAAAMSGSFSRAAAELGVTHGAISRAVASLERDLGVTLFVRDSRGVRLTAAGRELHGATSEALAGIELSIRSIKRSEEGRPLLVSCERSIALKWLVPRLASFQDAHPEATVYLSTGGGGVDFESSRLDLAVRRADFPMRSGWKVRPFMREYVGPVLRPDAAESYERGELPRLHSTGRPSAWGDWSALSGESAPPPARGDQYFDHFFLCLEAALSGLGAAVLPYAIAADELAAGRLSAPRGFLPDGSEYCIISQPSSSEDRLTALFSDWLESVAVEPGRA